MDDIATPRPSTPLDRRRFLTDVSKLGVGVAASGLGLTLLARQSKGLPATALRPPGALDESKFLAACVRCGLCVRACPYNTLKLADLAAGPAAGTPFFEARKIPCEMCDDIPCVKACPTGALDHHLPGIDRATMGVAVIVSRDTCLNLQGLRCDVCYRICPKIDKAITLEQTHNRRTNRHAVFEPVIHADECVGCGKCEKSCVLTEAAIKVLPISIALGHQDVHYRRGWEEKRKNNNQELIPGLIDLPDRMPEPKP